VIDWLIDWKAREEQRRRMFVWWVGSWECLRSDRCETKGNAAQSPVKRRNDVSALQGLVLVFVLCCTRQSRNKNAAIVWQIPNLSQEMMTSSHAQFREEPEKNGWAIICFVWLWWLIDWLKSKRGTAEKNVCMVGHGKNASFSEYLLP